MQIWAESGKSALPICNYSQILYQFLTFTQNLKRSHKSTTYLSNQLSTHPPGVSVTLIASTACVMTQAKSPTLSYRLYG